MGAMRLCHLYPLLLALPLFAQDDELPPDEVADLVERYVERGVESLREGGYEEARLRFQKALRRDKGNRRALLGVAESYRVVGAYDKAKAALQTLLEKLPGDRAANVMWAEIDLVHGKTTDVRTRLRSVIESGGDGPDLVGLRARDVLAASLAHDGRRDEARTVLDDVVSYYKRRRETLADAAFNAEDLRNEVEKARPLSEEMTLIARALRIYVDLSPLDFDYANNANELLGYALDLDPDNWEARTEKVRVTRLERYSAIGKARKAKAIADRRNPELADLYVEVAKSVLTAFNESEARNLAETALRINPNHADARAIAARVLLEDNQYPDAAEHLEKGLAINPRHRDLLALKATLDLLLGDKVAFEAGMKKMLAVDPSYGEGFHLAGLIVASRQRRYDRGVALVRRGLKLDPLNFQAHATLGIFLANMGRAEEARAALIKSKKMFPFEHPVRENMKDVLDYVLDSMTERRYEHFVIRFDPSEIEIMSLFLPELLEDCWTDMVKRYDFTPKTPILVEVFKNADDFSVRTLGLPGIPAIGACFGGLITLDSPQALPAGQFSWASTARHEFAHVMSLQLSGGQVPRWFTEGLSVLEEIPLDTGWGRSAGFERQVFDAWRTGTLPKIATFDAMFRSPRVSYAYYVGGLMLQFLKQVAGEDGIVKALRLYGRDRPMREVFRKSFDLELEQFDKRFAEFIGVRVGRYRIQPNYNLVRDRLAGLIMANGNNGEALLDMAWACYQAHEFVDAGAYFERAQAHLKPDEPRALLLDANLSQRAGRTKKARDLLERYFAAGGEDYSARMRMAAFHTAPEDEARYVAELKKAKEDWPVKVEGKSPYALLRRYYLGKGMEKEALAELEEAAAISSKSIGMRLQLAREYGKHDRSKDAIRALEEALRITLYDIRVFNALLPLYREAKDWKNAIRSARCRVALRSEEDEDEVAAMRYVDLGEVLLQAGNAKEAAVALAEAHKLASAEEVPAIAELEKKLGQKLGQ